MAKLTKSLGKICKVWVISVNAVFLTSIFCCKVNKQPTNYDYPSFASQFRREKGLISSKIFRFGFHLFMCFATYLFSNRAED